MTLLVPGSDDEKVLTAGAELLKAVDQQEGAELSCSVGGEKASLRLPPIVLRMLVETLGHLAQGNAVTLTPIHKELTTQQAADILGVSRPFLVKLLEEGKLPFRRLHKHRRIKLQDLLEFKNREDNLRLQALAELTQLTQELGLYD